MSPCTLVQIKQIDLLHENHVVLLAVLVVLAVLAVLVVNVPEFGVVTGSFHSVVAL
jgi:hypothetical protein